ncbi:Der1-like family-domain-containing protein [Phakopsora pachyrhizi]|nr:Der1-like family-domain-containing protein [Phakopsora pachyrhizi]
MFYRNSIALESRSIHFGNPSDYAWNLICLMASILITNYPLKTMIFWGPLMSGLSYMWSQINPDSLVSFFGLPPFKAVYFPFAMLGLDFFRGGMELATQSFTGILSGYIVHYLTNIYPSNNQGRRPWFMYPPRLLISLLDGPRQSTGGARPSRGWGGQAPIRPTTEQNSNRQSTANTRHTWGTGNRLG